MFRRKISNRLARGARSGSGAGQRGEAALPIGALFMVLVLGLALVGVAYGLWSKILTIEGTVQTGTVHAKFLTAFTDDDGRVNNTEKDANDVGDCPIGGRDISSCDPAASGRDPKPRYEKDVGVCVTRIGEDDNFAEVFLLNGYPSYFCTAWFDIVNDGSIPVRVASVTIDDVPVRPSVPTPFDLGGDERADVELHISEIRQCQQIEPGELVQMDIDQHVLQPAPQGATLGYTVKVQLNQFNESGCRVLLYFGNGGVDPFQYGDDSTYTKLQAHYEAMGFVVDYTDVWPADLSVYQLVILIGPGDDNDDGTFFFDAAQQGAMTSYMQSGGRVVALGDHSGLFGVNTINDLLSGLGVGISQNADAATPDADVCAPLTDLTADQVTAGLAAIDASAVSSLDLSGSAVGLARVDPAPYACAAGPVTNGATWMAVDQVAGAPARPGGDLVMIADFNVLDDAFGFNDPQGDGMTGAQLANNLVGY